MPLPHILENRKVFYLDYFFWKSGASSLGTDNEKGSLLEEGGGCMYM